MVPDIAGALLALQCLPRQNNTSRAILRIPSASEKKEDGVILLKVRADSQGKPTYSDIEIHVAPALKSITFTHKNILYVKPVLFSRTTEKPRRFVFDLKALISEAGIALENNSVKLLKT